MKKQRPTLAEDPHEKLVDLRKIGAIMEKNFIVITRDKTRLLPLVLFPVIMILIFGYTTGNAPKHIPTAIVAYDTSAASSALQSQIQASQTFTVRAIVSTEGEARRLLDNGEVRVIIEIPPDLERDLASQTQSTVTVIVDESDAAVAATATQTLAAVVSRASERIAQQRIAAFQASLEDATAVLERRSTPAPDGYAFIVQQTSAAEATLTQSQAQASAAADAMLLAMPLPTLYNPLPTTVAAEGHIYVSSNTSTQLSAGSETTVAQAALLRSTAAAAQSAATDVRAAGVRAQRGQAQAATLAASYADEVARPIAQIRVFTRSRTLGLLEPLTMEKKPAYGTGKRAVDFLIPSIIALTIFQGAVMGMGRAVAGEKREGALTRVFLTPTSNATIILGTLLFYVAFEMVRFTFLILVATAFFHLSVAGSWLLIALIIFMYAGISTGIGMILSSMVHSENQYMAVAMLVSLPTMFLAGVFIPVQAMPKLLQSLANVLPITYAADAFRGVMIKGFGLVPIAYPLLVLLLFLTLTMAGVFAVFRRDIE